MADIAEVVQRLMDSGARQEYCSGINCECNVVDTYFVKEEPMWDVKFHSRRNGRKIYIGKAMKPYGMEHGNVPAV